MLSSVSLRGNSRDGLVQGWRNRGPEARLAELQGQRMGDGRKVRIVARLRREMTMTLAWIAERLHMGAPGHVACLLCHSNQACRRK